MFWDPVSMRPILPIRSVPETIPPAANPGIFPERRGLPDYKSLRHYDDGITSVYPFSSSEYGDSSSSYGFS
jgi:hypothetical protein